MASPALRHVTPEAAPPGRAAPPRPGPSGVVAAVPEESLEAHVEVGVVGAALYESKALPGRDEVALAVRVWPQCRAPHKPDAEDGCTGALRRQLKRFGLAKS